MPTRLRYHGLCTCVAPSEYPPTWIDSLFIIHVLVFYLRLYVSMIQLYFAKQLQALQDNYDVLRNSVADLPSQVQEQCTTVLKLASEKCLLVQDMTKDVHGMSFYKQLYTVS